MLMHHPVFEQSVFQPRPSVPAAASQLHVAIICDGNGRWATSRALPRSAGHRAGAEAARRVIRSAPHLGIHTLTLFALSSANWARPAAEVAAILQILQEYLLAETPHCFDEGIRLNIIGRRDRLPATLRETIADSEALTANGRKLHLRLAIDYSARHTIFQAASKFYKVTNLSSEAFSNILAEVQRGGSTDVDLLIRTGGDKRLSDFLLWESAFAELWFTDQMWPDFDEAAFARAISEFRGRERAAILPEGRRPWETAA